MKIKKYLSILTLTLISNAHGQTSQPMTDEEIMKMTRDIQNKIGEKDLKKAHDLLNEQMKKMGTPLPDINQQLGKNKPKSDANSKPSEFDALNDPPLVKGYFRCTAPFVTDPEGYEDVVSGPCQDAALKAKTVQCRSDWMFHPLTKAMYQCGATHSIGSAKVRYQRIVDRGFFGDGRWDNGD